jgi:hypothetical protein
MPNDAASINQLADEYTVTLRRTGQHIHTYTTDDERDLYRRAGRRAGRQLHRPVRTFDTGNAVIIVLTDWGEHNPLEAALLQSRVNKMIESVMPNDPP